MNNRILSTIKNKINQAYMQDYNIETLIIIFFSSSFIGWIWEVINMFAEEGILVNRGILIGPYLPIYGCGCLLILLIFLKTKLKKICKNIFGTFLLTALLCTILEYGTSYYLEIVYGMKWWDYSKYFLNIHGRISFITSMFFGIMGCFCLYIYAPFIKEKVKKIPKKITIVICIILILFFLVDNIYSFKNPNTGNGITINIKQN